MIAPHLRLVLADCDYRRHVGEYLDEFNRIAPPEVVGANIHHYRLDELTEAGRWFSAAWILQNLIHDAEEYYATDTPTRPDHRGAPGISVLPAMPAARSSSLALALDATPKFLGPRTEIPRPRL